MQVIFWLGVHACAVQILFKTVKNVNYSRKNVDDVYKDFIWVVVYVKVVWKQWKAVKVARRGINAKNVWKDGWQSMGNVWSVLSKTILRLFPNDKKLLCESSTGSYKGDNNHQNCSDTDVHGGEVGVQMILHIIKKWFWWWSSPIKSSCLVDLIYLFL